MGHMLWHGAITGGEFQCKGLKQHLQRGKIDSIEILMSRAWPEKYEVVRTAARSPLKEISASRSRFRRFWTVIPYGRRWLEVRASLYWHSFEPATVKEMPSDPVP